MRSSGKHHPFCSERADDHGTYGDAWFELVSGLKIQTNAYSQDLGRSGLFDVLAERLQLERAELLLQRKEPIGKKLWAAYGSDDRIYRLSLEDLYPKNDNGDASRPASHE